MQMVLAGPWARNTVLLAFQVGVCCAGISSTYPFKALKWFDAEGKESDYDGGRDLTAFTT